MVLRAEYGHATMNVRAHHGGGFVLGFSLFFLDKSTTVRAAASIAFFAISSLSSGNRSFLIAAPSRPYTHNNINRMLALMSPPKHQTSLLSHRMDEDDTARSLSAILLEKWGVDFEPSCPVPSFPRTCSEVADCCLNAITATLDDKAMLDPSSASNAMRRSVLDHRPVHNGQGRDKGRLGIELDGTRYLLAGSVPPSAHDAEGRGIRRVALILASKLAQLSWDRGDGKPGPSSHHEGIVDRPILVYFNCRQSSLLASREVALLKREEIMRDVGRRRGTGSIDGSSKSIYDNVQVHSLDEGIPDAYFDAESTRNRGRQTDFDTGRIEPSRGMVLVVQPTDVNNEARPPATACGKILSLQKILAQASIARLPSVIVSPRLTEQYAVYEREKNGLTNANRHVSRGRSFSHRGAGGGFDQSGYQQSATYGGAEPPRGPTPWITRDFTPPIFVWVGRALEMVKGRERASPAYMRHMLGEQEGVDSNTNLEYYSSIGLMQSVCDTGRPWHLFVALESLQREHSTYSPNRTTYRYVANTRASNGRPTSNVLENIYKFWRLEHHY